LTDAQRQLLVSAFSAQRVNEAGARLVGDINWAFAPTAETLAMIPAAQTVNIRFELVLQDELDAEHRMAVNVQAQGSNETSSFAGDLNTVMRASDGRVTGTATVVDVDVDEDQFVAQTVQGQFGVLTVQADGEWLYVLNDGAVVPSTATISDRFELATRDDAGQGVRPVVTVYIKGPDLLISASGNAPSALTSPVPVVTAPNAGTPADPAQTPGSAALQVVPLGGAPIEVPLGNMNPYTPPAGPSVTLPGAGESSRREDSPNDPAAQSTEPQQQSVPQEAQPQAATTMQPEQQAIAEETLQEKPEQVSLIDQLTDMADSGSAALSVMGMAAAVAMGKGQRIQWQSQKTAQPSRQRIQW
jgi:VCBS repeat-containing protein